MNAMEELLKDSAENIIENNVENINSYLDGDSLFIFKGNLLSLLL